ncbi:hypothetical protein PUR71_07480 [Streptomyces sp. SP17BM10]|uniref:hypothetical protein n=1 Tax=Streptomyces sp. SP17BM10 TaxID=3002530 RepID=UPI002E7A5623|nr:hypothetical protein [Streptomyces sp. SP17BM10]MEE1782757.1 hypothetical protein [Streptomyces sp. SP17BM10]
MSFSLPHLLTAAASLLRAAGPLPPVNVSIALPFGEGGIIQIDNPGSIPMTDRMAMVDTMAGLLDATTRLNMLASTGKDYGYHAQGTVDGVPVLVTAVATSWDKPSTSTRTTTTADIALALEEIAPWAASLDTGRGGDLTVIEASDGPRVLLVLLAEDNDDRRAAVTAAIEGLPSDITHQGRRAQALLPNGLRLKVITQ